MTTKVQIIKEVKGKILQEKELVYKEIYTIEDSRISDYSQLIHKYFGEVLQEEDTINVSCDRVEFTRPQEGYSYNKELLSLYIPQGWREEDTSEIETSFYSTSENSDYELQRMILIGKVGAILLDFKDDILAGWNHIRGTYKEQLSSLSGQAHKLSSKVVLLEIEEEELERQKLLNKAEEVGIEFNPVERNYSYKAKLPQLQISFDKVITGVKKIKILSKTISGKSANIEVVRLFERWDMEEQKYINQETTNTYQKVKMAYVDSLLKNKAALVTV